MNWRKTLKDELKRHPEAFIFLVLATIVIVFLYFA
jgi:hypothetical protein